MDCRKRLQAFPTEPSDDMGSEKKTRKTRANMTHEQREKDAAQKRYIRCIMSPEQRQAERDKNAAKQRQCRANLNIKRLEADAARKRHTQAHMSPERRQADAARKRQYRAHMSPERRQAVAAREKNNRANMSPERRQAVAAREKNNRANMSPERRQAAAAREKNNRANMSPERRQAAATRKRQSRAKMSAERHQAECDKHAAQAALQSPETPVIPVSRTTEQRRYAALDSIRHLQEQQRGKRLKLHRIARKYNIDQLAHVEILTLQHTSGLMEARCAHCNALMWIAERVGGSLKAPNFGLCCLSGKIQIPSVPDPPHELCRLLTENNATSNHFRPNIRRFNAAMSMATMKTTNATVRGGVANFRISGVVYRMIGSPRSSNDTDSLSLQTYFYDAEEQLQRRLKLHPPACDMVETEKNIFRTLHLILKNAPNTYLQSFWNIQELIDKGTVPKNISIAIHADKRPDKEHARCFNQPTSSEVSILLPNQDTSYQNSRTVICTFRAHGSGNQGLQHFKDTHRSYDPLCYPILFPYGTDGYHLGIPQLQGKRTVTAKQFYAYRIMKRADKFNILHHGSRLFQQYCVDMWAKIETGRLEYLRFNQENLRAELYSGLQDALHVGDSDRAGRRVVLPATFTGGPRFMAKHYHDAMAIVRKFGKPTLFITFTCNAQWAEIVSELEPHQTAADRPDITARVFKMKQQQVLSDIKAGVLGDLKAYVYTIEFQKRGLPHCHFLFILHGEQQTWQDVDRVISAELPHPSNPCTRDLMDCVKKFMVHGPCGAVNPNCPCMIDGRCSKDFPKDFTPQTRLTDDCYPTYRRRSPDNGGHTATVTFAGKTIVIDNRNVVPYNPWLLQKYRAHLNVEYCASIKAVKYLYKYIYKGSDQATITFESEESQVRVDIENHIDEIRQYEQCRYIGASEATWRIFAFPTQDRSPAVEPLPVHLPDEQRVVFNPSNAEQALEAATRTKLTAYFSMNHEDPNARSILYCDFPEHFTWQSAAKVWRKRARPPGNKPQTIGRVFSVHPSQGETFYLRLLLHHKTGATSFQDLRVIDGQVCETFKKCCQLLNLLEDDNEWFQCLAESAHAQRPVSMRGLFVTILLFCEPTEPLRLYQQYLDDLMQDFQYRRRKQGLTKTALQDASENDLLCDLDDRLQQQGRKAVDFGLPPPNQRQRSQLDCAAEEIDPDASTTFSEHIQQLTGDQAAAFDIIRDKIDSKIGGIVFIDAPGGTGKTFLLNVILAYVRQKNRIALATASSGIAATLLKLGRTSHSRFKLPIPPSQNSTCKISPRDMHGRLLEAADILVWDEAPMSHRYLLEALDRSLQDIMKNNTLLGGKLLILAGDFRQILPVVRRGRRPDIVDACMTKSPLWKHCSQLKLRTNMRVLNSIKDGDNEGRERVDNYASWLLQLGEGNLPNANGTPYDDAIELPSNLCALSEEEVINHVYSDLEEYHHHTNQCWLGERAVLTSKNADVDRLNDNIMRRLPGDMFVIKSADSIAETNQATLYPTEFLNSINLSGMPPHQMTLKVHAPIMLLRNLDPRNGHCNGTRYILTSVSDRLLHACMLAGEHKGSLLMIPRILLSPSDTDLPFTLRRRQFPIRPAFAMTINKSQGQSLKCCGLHLPNSVFTHGQLYVAASRVGDPQHLRIFADQSEFCQQTTQKKADQTDTLRQLTRNVVYSEALVY